MAKVNVYRYGAFLYSMECERYEPNSEVDRVCRYFPTVEPKKCRNGKKCRERVELEGWRGFGYFCFGPWEAVE